MSAVSPAVTLITRDSVATSGTARGARSRYRQVESSVARWRLLTDSAAVLASEGQRPAALAAVLTYALAFLSLDDGLLMLVRDNALQVCAAQGLVMPLGARILPSREMQALKQSGAPAAQVRQEVRSALRIGRDQPAGLEVMVPLCFDGKIVGMLTLLGGVAAPLPDGADLATLQALATMLAAAVALPAAPAPRIAKVDSAAQLKMLTPRELEVFALLPSGMTNAAMGRQLGIGAGTVKTHVERILHKLNLHDRTQAAVRAADCGLTA